MTLYSPSFLRRTKAEVLTHIIPPMAEIIVPVSMTTLQRKLYKSILSKDPNLIKSILYRGEAKQKERAKLNNLLMQLRKCVCHPFLYSQDVEERLDDPVLVHQNLVEAGSKLKLLSIMLPKLQSQGHRVLLFSQFLGMLDIVEDFLEGIGMKYQRLDGSTSTLQKQKCIDAFNAPNSEYFAFLLSTRAGGVGINLATADTVIILDPDFNPHQDIQALSRAHRIGQKNKVLCMRLVTRDTVEQKILDIGKKKRTMDHVIVERMGNEDEEEVVDVESILRFGVESLFSDDAEDRTIVYDDANVEKLLNREHITNTIQGNDGPTSAESSSFGFARVWQNDTGTFEAHNPEESADETHSPEPGFWEKVLRQREEEARREEAARQAELAKGRRRKVINYAAFDRDDKAENVSDGSDTDFREEPGADADSDGDSDHGHMADLFMDMDIRTLENAEERARLTGLLRNTPQHKQFQMAAAASQNPLPSTGSSNMALPASFPGMPLGLTAPTCHENAIPAPLYRPGGIPQPGDPDYDPRDWIHTRVVPPVLVDGPPHLPRCPACGSRHEGGARLCPLHLAGVERCPFCNVAHLGDPKSCPHLKSETQIRRLLEALDKSSEPKDIVDLARKFCVDRLAVIRRGKKKKSEAAKKVEEMAKAQAATAIHNRA